MTRPNQLVRCWLVKAIVVLGSLATICVAPASAQVSSTNSWETGRAPDLAVVLVGSVDYLDSAATNVSGALMSLDGVAAAVAVPVAVDTSVVYLTASGAVDASLLAQVELVARQGSGEVTVSVLGLAAADVRMQQSIERELLLTVSFVVLLTAAGLALAFGWRMGLGAAVVLGSAAYLGVLLCWWFGLRFTGSILSTALPGVLASMLVVTMVGYRVVIGAEPSSAGTLVAIRTIIADAAKRLDRSFVAMLAPVMMVWLFAAALVASANPVLSTLLGALAGAVLAVTLVPLLVQVGEMSFERPSQRLLFLFREHQLAPTLRTAAGVLIFVITAVGVLNSFGQPTAAALDATSADARVPGSTALDESGDLTKAIALRFAEVTDAATVDAFAAEVSRWPSVQVVQTASALFSDGELRANSELGRIEQFAALDGPSGRSLFVVPANGARSVETRQLVLDLDRQQMLPAVELDPKRLGEAQLPERSGWLIIVAVALSILVTLAEALNSGRNLIDVFWLGVVRLFILLSVIGLASVLMRSEPVDEIILLVLLSSLALGFFEASQGKAAVGGRRAQLPGALNKLTIAARLRTPIRSSSLGLVVLAAMGATWMFGPASFLRPLGLALLVSSLAVAAAVSVLLPSLHYSLAFGFVSSNNPDGLGWDLASLRPSLPRRFVGRIHQLGQTSSRPRVPRVWRSSEDSFLRTFEAEASNFKPERSQGADSQDSDSQGADSQGADSQDSDSQDSDSPDVDSQDAESPGDNSQAVGLLAQASGNGASDKLEPHDSGEAQSPGVDPVEVDPVEAVPGQPQLSEPLADHPNLLGIEGLSGLELAGEGGFALVYRALNESGEAIAIKVLMAMRNPQELRRFEREQRALQALDDVDGVIDLLAVGKTAEGGPYLTMPFVDGGTLAQRVKESPLSWHAAHSLGCRLAETLSACHELGIFHRDLKPSNVLLGEDQRPYLIDFGSTQILDGRSLSARSSFTPNYCPPEVLDHGNEDSNGALVDVYGLGTLLWAAVTGRRPFVLEGENNEVPTLFKRVATHRLEPLKGTPRWFADVVEVAVAKDPVNRFSSMSEMLDALAHRSLPEHLREAVDLSSMHTETDPDADPGHGTDTDSGASTDSGIDPGIDLIAALSETDSDNELLVGSRDRADVDSNSEVPEGSGDVALDLSVADDPADPYHDLTTALARARAAVQAAMVTADSDSESESEPAFDRLTGSETFGKPTAAAPPTAVSTAPTSSPQTPSPSSFGGWLSLFARRPAEALAAGKSRTSRKGKTLNKKRDAIDWQREVARLVRSDFYFAASPGEHDLETVFFPGTKVYRQAEDLQRKYLRLGIQVAGDQPRVDSVLVINADAPTRLEMLVSHPPCKLVNGDGETVEELAGEQRRSSLWLVETDAGYRISAIVLQSSEPLGGADEAGAP